MEREPAQRRHVAGGDDDRRPGERERDAGQAVPIEPFADERRQEQREDRVEGDQERRVRRARMREGEEEEPRVEHAAADDHHRKRRRRAADAIRGPLPERERQEDGRGERVAPHRHRERRHVRERDLAGDERGSPADRGQR